MLVFPFHPNFTVLILNGPLLPSQSESHATEAAFANGNINLLVTRPNEMFLPLILQVREVSPQVCEIAYYSFRLNVCFFWFFSRHISSKPIYFWSLLNCLYWVPLVIIRRLKFLKVLPLTFFLSNPLSFGDYNLCAVIIQLYLQTRFLTRTTTHAWPTGHCHLDSQYYLFKLNSLFISHQSLLLFLGFCLRSWHHHILSG